MNTEIWRGHFASSWSPTLISSLQNRSWIKLGFPRKMPRRAPGVERFSSKQVARRVSAVDLFTECYCLGALITFTFGMTPMVLEHPSVAQLSQVITQVTAPAFLLGAVASFTSVLIARMKGL